MEAPDPHEALVASASEACRKVAQDLTTPYGQRIRELLDLAALCNDLANSACPKELVESVKAEERIRRGPAGRP
jgi:hypothetical protein